MVGLLAGWWFLGRWAARWRLVRRVAGRVVRGAVLVPWCGAWGGSGLAKGAGRARRPQSGPVNVGLKGVFYERSFLDGSD